ncbi:MAG TPA: alpha/beta hydrolase [Candidimonas sp.]|nr:alpha/beta hydrolase [Candidimonas sp.]
MVSTLALPHYTATTGHSMIHYTEAGAGQMLVLLHGSLCDYRYWRWQLPALAQHYRVVAPSLYGFWPNALDREDPEFSVRRHVEDTVNLLRSLSNDGPVHVLGHSRGAQVALEVACNAPELVRSLTLADPGFRIDEEPPMPSVHADIARMLRQGQLEEAMAGFVDAVNGAGTWRQMTSWFKTMVKDNAYTLLSQLREINLAIRLEQAAALRCPVLLIGGAHSPPRYGNRLDVLENALLDATRTTIPLASHGMNLANPKAFNGAVLSFLDARRFHR